MITKKGESFCDEVIRVDRVTLKAEVPFSTVRYFQSDMKYTEIHHDNGVLVVELSLKAAMQVYGDRLLQIHRGTLVSRSRIARIGRNTEGRKRRDTPCMFVKLHGVDAPLAVSKKNEKRVRQEAKAILATQ